MRAVLQSAASGASVDFDLAYISLDYIAVSLCVFECVCGKASVCV